MAQSFSYINVKSKYPALKSISNGGNGTKVVIDIYEPQRTYYEIPNKYDHMGFLVYNNVKREFRRPFGVSVNGPFSFSIGNGNNEVEFTVNESNTQVTAVVKNSRQTKTWDINIPNPLGPQSETTAGRIYTLSYDGSSVDLCTISLKNIRYESSTPYYFQNASIFGDTYYTITNEEYFDFAKGNCTIYSPILDSELTGGFTLTGVHVRPARATNVSASTAFYTSVTYQSGFTIDWDDVIEERDPEQPTTPTIDPNTPLEPGDYPDDDVDYPPLPDISITDAGFVTIFNPTILELHELSNYMWSDAFSLDSFKKLLADPMDAIIGLSIIPCPIQNGPIGQVYVGNIPTGISMVKAASQWAELDCGEVFVRGQWGTYTDYAPYTKISIFLPYIGINQLNVDDVVGGSIGVRYHIDICTGSLVCYVRVVKNGVHRLLYTFNSQCAVQVPLTGVSYASQMQAVIGAAVTAATGGMAGVAEVGAGLANDPVGGLQKLKPDVQRSGSISQSCGLLANQYPYLIWERPEIKTAESFEKFRGVGSQITGKIRSSKGYTVVDDINLSGLSATDAEKNEIIGLLKGGVIV